MEQKTQLKIFELNLVQLKNLVRGINRESDKKVIIVAKNKKNQILTDVIRYLDSSNFDSDKLSDLIEDAKRGGELTASPARKSPVDKKNKSSTKGTLVRRPSSQTGWADKLLRKESEEDKRRAASEERRARAASEERRARDAAQKRAAAQGASPSKNPAAQKKSPRKVTSAQQRRAIVRRKGGFEIEEPTF